MDIGGAVVRREAVASGRSVGREEATRTRCWLASVLPPPLIVIPLAALLGIGLALTGLSAVVTSLPSATPPEVVEEGEGAIPWVSEEDVDLGHFSMRLGPMYTR
jgi:hypothetical protein